MSIYVTLYTDLLLRTALAIVRLEHCIMDINHWMSANRLKLNIDKTELIWTGTKYSVTAGIASFPSLRLDADVILPSQHVRLLGVVISADLGLETVSYTHLTLPTKRIV